MRTLSSGHEGVESARQRSGAHRGGAADYGAFRRKASAVGGGAFRSGGEHAACCVPEHALTGSVAREELQTKLEAPLAPDWNREAGSNPISSIGAAELPPPPSTGGAPLSTAPSGCSICNSPLPPPRAPTRRRPRTFIRPTERSQV